MRRREPSCLYGQSHMNISRSEQRTLHAMAQGGAIVLTRDPDGRLLAVQCFTREGYLLTDCNLSVWRRLKKKGKIPLDG